MNILVTGASGFIGNHLINALLHRGDCIAGITRNKSNYPKDNGVVWHSWEEIDESFFKEKKIEVVIHLATAYGRDGSVYDVEYANVSLPLHLFELCVRQSVPFINTDSFFSKAEFNSSYMMSYVMSKKMFLTWAKIICLQQPVAKFINMRLEHVYGPNDSKDKFVSFLIREISSERKVVKCTLGSQRRDFIHVSDVVSAYITILDHINEINNGFNEYQVGTGISTRLRTFIDILRKTMSADDVYVDFGAIDMREDEIMDSKADIRSLEKLGWHAFYSVESGIFDMVTSINEMNSITE